MSFETRGPTINTLRARLTLWYLAILAASVVLFAAFLYLSLNRDLYQLHDSELREEAERLAHALTGVALTDASIRPSVHDSLRSVQFLVVQGMDGEILFRVPQTQPGESDFLNEALLGAFVSRREAKATRSSRPWNSSVSARCGSSRCRSACRDDSSRVADGSGGHLGLANARINHELDYRCGYCTHHHRSHRQDRSAELVRSATRRYPH